MQISSLDSWIKDKIGYSGSRSFREELNIYILEKLQENVNYVKENSRFYKEYFKKINRIDSFRRFEELPFTSSSDLLNAPSHFVCVPQNKIDRIVTMQSSGTGGQCKRIFFTKEDQELTIDFFQKGMLNLLERGYKTLILLPSNREGSVGELLRRALKMIEVDSFICNHIYNKEKLLRIIEEKSIDTIVGTPMQLYLLSNYVKDTMNINLKSILLSTDYAPKMVIEKIKRIFNCKVFDHYGMTEMGLGGGVQCAAFDGYHLREGDLYFEIIDSSTEKTLSPGLYGEIVFTTLTRKGMPLIRYRTGDISRLINSSCMCGSEIKRLDRVITRTEGSVLLADKTVVTIGEISELLFSIDAIKDFNVIITKNHGKDYLNVFVDLFYMKNNLFKIIFDKLMSWPTIMTLVGENKLVLNIREKSKGSAYSDINQKKVITDIRDKE